MVAKKMPAKKMPAKKMPAKAAPKKTSTVSQAEAEAIVKRAFLAQAKQMGPSDIRKYGDKVAPKRQGSAAQWARNVDNALGDTWFEGAEANKIGFDRANKILKQNREKWIAPMYNTTIGSRATKINEANKKLPKKK